MKYSQTILSVMFCILYAATMFGAEETTALSIPSVIWRVVGEFRGKNYFYKKTCNTEQYSFLSNLLRKVVSTRNTFREARNSYFINLKSKEGLTACVSRDLTLITGNKIGTEGRRSLSDMKLEQLRRTRLVFSCQHEFPEIGITYESEGGKIRIYLSDDHKLKDELSSLPTSKNVTIFTVFGDGKTIIAVGKDGSIHQWELQRELQDPLF